MSGSPWVSPTSPASSGRIDGRYYSNADEICKATAVSLVSLMVSDILSAFMIQKLGGREKVIIWR